MSAEDPLDGYRGTPMELARRVEQAKPDDVIWDRLYLGESAKGMMLGVARREDISKVMAAMIAQCEYNTQRAAKEFIEFDDPGCADARHAHFLARVEAAILGRLNQFINDGYQAADTINNV